MKFPKLLDSGKLIHKKKLRKIIHGNMFSPNERFLIPQKVNQLFHCREKRLIF